MLAGKKIVVTGSAGLLGSQFVRAISKRDGTPIAVDVDSSRLDSLRQTLDLGSRRKVIFAKLDVTRQEDVADFFSSFSRADYPDALVNNAAANPSVENADKATASLAMSLVDWEEKLRVGLWGPFLVSREFIANRSDSDRHIKVVNIGSDFGHIAPTPEHYADLQDGDGFDFEKPAWYTVMKHGLHGLTRHLASQHGGINVTVNTLSPGGVRNSQPNKFIETVSSAVPMGRMAEAHEIASSLCFLLSDEASYVNGHELIVDGGRSIR